ncbi:MAG: 6-phosphogluconolactonase [Pedosphaera sp.]|nr:6-phosphogluconolactonase [Pedosphaera sp.]
MAYDLFSYPTAGELAEGVATDWLRQMKTRRSKEHDKNPPCSVALSGGRIAQTFFNEVARHLQMDPDFLTNVFIKDAHLFWADERCVPPTDPESNYAIAKQLLFDPLKIPDGQIHRLRGEQDEALALREAVGDVLAVVPRQSGAAGKGQPVFDIIFLGMGEDGHVASLFPGEPVEVMSSPAIYRSVTAVKPPPHRITMGYGVIAAATEVWVLASGKGKEQALRESLAPQGKTPLARVLRSRAQTKIFTDIAGVA